MPKPISPPEPIPVAIETPSPMPVSIEAPATLDVNVVDDLTGSHRGSPSNRIQNQKIIPSLPADTTFQEDLVTAGQRRINLIWEYTQATSAIMVIATAMIVSVLAMIYKYEIPNLLATAFGMVTGFYFARTNHEKIGGPGTKRISDYVGR